MKIMHKSRRDFLRNIGIGSVTIAGSTIFHSCEKTPQKPNILFCISDDRSWIHNGAYGSTMVKTPIFDRIAREGALFKNAFVSAPSCCPSRGSILSGLPFYRLKEASMNHTIWPDEIEIYTDLLASAGYHIGFTGKGWGPGNWKTSGRVSNPAGQEYNQFKSETPSKSISAIDYARNFKNFLEKRDAGAPFCFWYGGFEPHRIYEAGSGLRNGKKLEEAEVPPFFPDAPEVRSDLLDYAFHIEWFDIHLGGMIQILEEMNELDNTIIVITADNGMPFPRAKATPYDYGTHMPLAIRWGNKIQAGRKIDDCVSFIDFAPTFLDAAGLKAPDGMHGRSLLNILLSDQSGQIDASRDHVIIGIERHLPGGRKSGDGYPIRAIRTKQHLYIRNYAPERFPVGDPDGPAWPGDDPSGGYGDTDGSPTKTFMWQNRKKYPNLFQLAFDKRQSEELYDVVNDPFQMNNIASNPDYASIKKDLSERLHEELVQSEDPRELGKGDVLDGYARKYCKI